MTMPLTRKEFLEDRIEYLNKEIVKYRDALNAVAYKELSRLDCVAVAVKALAIGENSSK